MTAVERVELAQWEYERARQELHDAQAAAYAAEQGPPDEDEDCSDLG